MTVTISQIKVVPSKILYGKNAKGWVVLLNGKVEYKGTFDSCMKLVDLYETHNN